MRVAAFDPGQTTGAILVDVHKRDISVILGAWEIEWVDRLSIVPLLASMFTSSYGSSKPQSLDAIVVESFSLYAHKARQQIGSDFPSVRVMGIIEVAADLQSALGRIRFLPPSCKKGVKILHQLPITNSEHVKDAYQLARYYACTRPANENP